MTTSDKECLLWFVLFVLDWIWLGIDTVRGDKVSVVLDIMFLGVYLYLFCHAYFD